MNPAMTGSQEQTMMNSLSTKGKSVSKYCNISKTPRRNSTPPPSLCTTAYIRAPINGLPQDGRGGGGVGQPTGIRLSEAHMGRECDILNVPRVGNLTQPLS